MLHQTFVVWIVKVSFPKPDFVVQRRILYTLNYLIHFLLVFFLWESGKSVLDASNTLLSLKVGVNKCTILKFQVMPLRHFNYKTISLMKI